MTLWNCSFVDTGRFDIQRKALVTYFSILLASIVYIIIIVLLQAWKKKTLFTCFVGKDWLKIMLMAWILAINLWKQVKQRFINEKRKISVSSKFLKENLLETFMFHD